MSTVDSTPRRHKDGSPASRVARGHLHPIPGQSSFLYVPPAVSEQPERTDSNAVVGDRGDQGESLPSRFPRFRAALRRIVLVAVIALTVGYYVVLPLAIVLARVGIPPVISVLGAIALVLGGGCWVARAVWKTCRPIPRHLRDSDRRRRERPTIAVAPAAPAVRPLRLVPATTGPSAALQSATHHRTAVGTTSTRRLAGRPVRHPNLVSKN